jgi:hypothetical protein
MPALDPISSLGIDAGNELTQQNFSLRDHFRRLQEMSNREGELDEVSRARGEAIRGSEIDAGTFERRTRGLDLSKRQLAGAGKKVGLSRAIAQAERTGGVRRGFTDRARKAEKIGAGFSDLIFGQDLQQKVSEANIFGQQTAAAAERKAAKKSSTLSTLGTLAGTALAIAFGSSEAHKDKAGEEKGLLERLKDVRVERWNYKGSDVKHIGPYSEEFNSAFNVGEDNPSMISVIDALGVTLGAVKELNEKVEARG